MIQDKIRNKLNTFLKKTDTEHYIFYLIVIFISLGTALYANYPAFVNEYVRTDDARANIFWFHRLVDNKLFQNDLLTEFAIFYEATGTKYLYTFASYVIDPFILARIIPIVLQVVTGVVLYKMGRHLKGPYCGFIFTLLFICYPSHLDYFNCGYSRIFSYPGLILFLYFLITRQTKHLMWLIPLLSLFYPIAFLICAVTYSSWILLRILWIRIGIDPKKLVTHFLIAIIISGCFIIPKYLFSNDRFGRLLTFEETVDNPGVYKNGRNKLLPHTPVYEKVIDTLNEPFIIISFLVIFYFAGRKSLKIPHEFWLFILSGLLLYQLAYYFLLHLYFPYKYFRYSFPIIVFFVISYGYGSLIERIPSKAGKIASLIILICVCHYFYGDTIEPAAGMRDYSDKSELYDYLNTLPPDSLIAAPPYLADNIPLFAARKVLFNYELASPWFTKYYDIIKERTEDFYSAYYSDNIDELRLFTLKHGVDYIIVDKKLFRYLGRRRFYIEPYNDFIKKQVQKEKFYLKDHMEQLAQYKFDRYYVIDTLRFFALR